MQARQKIKYIYLKDTGSTNTSDHGRHLWPGHQILRDKSSLKGENVASSRSGSNTATCTLYTMLIFFTLFKNGPSCSPDNSLSRG